MTSNASMSSSFFTIYTACYGLEDGEKGSPEKLTIDFNNFP